jgi:hypothetical protein
LKKVSKNRLYIGLKRPLLGAKRAFSEMPLEEFTSKFSRLNTDRGRHRWSADTYYIASQKPFLHFSIKKCVRLVEDTRHSLKLSRLAEKYRRNSLAKKYANGTDEDVLHQAKTEK